MTDVPGTDPLEALVTRTAQAVEALPPEERIPWVFARCWIHACRYESLSRDADIDQALADFQALPFELPGRAKLAAVLAAAMLKSGRLLGSPRLSWAVALADVADTDPAPLQDWPVLSAALHAADLLKAAEESRRGFDSRAAAQKLEEFAGVVGDAQPYADLVRTAQLAVQHLLVQENPTAAEARQVTEHMREFSDQMADRPASVRDRAEIMQLMLTMHAMSVRSDFTGLERRLDELRDSAQRCPPGDPMGGWLEQMADSTAALLALLRHASPGRNQTAGTGGAALTDVQALLHRFRETAAQPGHDDRMRAFHLAQLAMAELLVDTRQSVDDAISHLTEALELSPAHDPRRPFYQISAGTAYLRLVELTGDRQSLKAGTDLLEQARDATASSMHMLWTSVTMPLAHAYRLSGRMELGRSTALRGLRGHAWSVLLESTADEMQAIARHAAGDALFTARWCLEDDAAEDAAVALDAGRGLILYAATETRDLTARLTATGHAELAAEWQRARAAAPAGEVPMDLRRRVMTALSGVPVRDDGAPVADLGEGASRLLDPPDGQETRAALRALGADALVYLMPGDELDGAAVVVPVDAPASWLRLPRLNDSGTAAFDGFLTDAARGTADGNTDRRGSALRDAVVSAPQVLDGICEWAWDAVIGPLFERLLLPAGRPVRLVLIPLRELARVPWHAARTRAPNGTWRYAMERAVFSYAPSARLLCETAGRQPVPLTEGGLVVGDPDTAGAARELPGARLEALAVRDCFYPDARYIGRMPGGEPSPEGAGTAAEVLRWFSGPDGGSMVHLACHGIVEESTAPGESSYLLLHRGEHLAAERVLDALVRGPGRDVALAVLAACSTGRSGRGHDEAFSLSTTLLAGRVRSVVSATWSVEDAATSVLMFLFHHYLRAEGMRPADALHHAQLCMIGRREEPATMPSHLREQLRTHQESDLASWAAFVHIGW
ncbi:CHAT domain-containing protein [Streptomyces sp. NPDC001843]|uniref:CHAT domain-containing protein n=1 Tax=Streptomyces sp. NPDC001843 TaxID=3364617 RepID=UPI00369AC25E